MKRFQKEVLVLLFIILTFYPAYRFYSRYRQSFTRAIKKTGEISSSIARNLAMDTVSHNGLQDTFRFNLNEVSWEALTLIPGIGEHTARKIVTYRLKNGKFRKVEDVLKIKGIGPSTLKKLKPYVYVGKD